MLKSQCFPFIFSETTCSPTAGDNNLCRLLFFFASIWTPYWRRQSEFDTDSTFWPTQTRRTAQLIVAQSFLSCRASCAKNALAQKQLLYQIHYRPASKHNYLCSIARPRLLSIFQDISRGVWAPCVNTPSDDQPSGFVAFLSSQCGIF